MRDGRSGERATVRPGHFLIRAKLLRRSALGAHTELRSRRKQSRGATEKVIRERAYELWDHAGRPNDRSDECWFAARAEFERRKGWEKDSCARLFAGGWSRLVMNRPLIGGRGSQPRGFEMGHPVNWGRESSV